MRIAAAGLAGLLSVLAAGAALAQPAAAPGPAPAGSGASVETTTIANLLADPTTKAVLQKDMPELVAYPGLDQIKDMSLRDISKFPQAKLDDARLASIQKDLDAAKGH
jgi:hypothetical protein